MQNRQLQMLSATLVVLAAIFWGQSAATGQGDHAAAEAPPVLIDRIIVHLRSDAVLTPELQGHLEARAGMPLKLVRIMQDGSLVYNLLQPLPLEMVAAKAKLIGRDPEVLFAEPDGKAHSATPAEPASSHH